MHVAERYAFLKNMMTVILMLMDKGQIATTRVIHNVVICQEYSVEPACKSR